MAEEQEMDEEIDEDIEEVVEEKPVVVKKGKEEVEYPGLPEDVEVVEERVYVVPLWKAVRGTRGLHRAKRGALFLKRFISRHMKSPSVKISPEVNEIIWSRGIRNPPRRIKVRVVRTSKEEVWVLKYE